MWVTHSHFQMNSLKSQKGMLFPFLVGKREAQSSPWSFKPLSLSSTIPVPQPVPLPDYSNYSFPKKKPKFPG